MSPSERQLLRSVTNTCMHSRADTIHTYAQSRKKTKDKNVSSCSSPWDVVTQTYSLRAPWVGCFQLAARPCMTSGVRVKSRPRSTYLHINQTHPWGWDKQPIQKGGGNTAHRLGTWTTHSGGWCWWTGSLTGGIRANSLTLQPQACFVLGNTPCSHDAHGMRPKRGPIHSDTLAHMHRLAKKLRVQA